MSVFNKRKVQFFMLRFPAALQMFPLEANLSMTGLLWRTAVYKSRKGDNGCGSCAPLRRGNVPSLGSYRTAVCCQRQLVSCILFCRSHHLLTVGQSKWVLPKVKGSAPLPRSPPSQNNIPLKQEGRALSICCLHSQGTDLLSCDVQLRTVRCLNPYLLGKSKCDMTLLCQPLYPKG